MTVLQAVQDEPGHTCADVLAEALAPFAGELALIDPAELIVLCRAEKHSNINDVVESAAELFFRPDTLRYGGAAEAEAGWDTGPEVTLDMEFQNAGVIALFRLTLRAGPPLVGECHVLFERADAGGPSAPLLSVALSDARCGFN